MKYARGTPISWLISCPASDCNFKANLKRASMSELKLALEEIPQKGNKTKRAAIEGEIKRRNR
ncbi:MAG: hypothetical protein K2N23_00275 [Clostridia bacterium]|nr:hypothetical protein [Clostridia bacterium]